jgi:cell division septation protein DedD
MNLSLLSLLLILNLMGSKTPNFYPSYLAAKEASKNYQKDMLVFFSKNACAECDAAWEAFEKDQMATKIFISTIVDAQDFDGAVILDKYGLSSAPSWVILDYEGNLKQKWTGEWKNPHVRPATPPQETVKPEVQPVKEFKATTATQKSATVTSSNATTSAVPVEPTPVVTTEKETTPSTQPIVNPIVNTPVSGFVLQAGYFGSETNAMKLVKDLESKGFKDYSVKSTTQNGSMFYRVISAVYTSEAEANKIIQALSTTGVKATVKKTSEI